MRALILAAGQGKRLEGYRHRPKCLLEFGGQSLLERHISLLHALDIAEIAVAVGYEAEQVSQALEKLPFHPQPQTVYNSDFKQGSVVSLWVLREYLCAGGEVLVLDADVLYDQRLLQRLVRSPHPNCLLLDRHFEPGVEPVKICLREGIPVEFRKQIAADLSYDTLGESVGFFRFSEATARRLTAHCQIYITQAQRETPHEEAIRDLILEAPTAFGIEDITGLPWIEIDFPQDVVTARQKILPHLQPRLKRKIKAP
jgi:choline kinase